jgi:NAD+ dependent glucose-6-phosphate dehydrogenase
MDDPVLLTGAGGRVGRAILDGIGEDYDWRLLYHSEPVEQPDLPYMTGELVDEADMREAVAGVSAVVHLAGDPRPEAPWESVLSNNIDGTRVLLEACRAAGVERFVFASSNHAVGHYETERAPDLYRRDDDFRLDGAEFPRPGNFYGVSKATGELLTRYYHDEHGIDAVCVRIGNLTVGHPPVDYERGQAMWLSGPDCAHLFDRCLRADYDFEIVYGISDNDRKYYSIERAREALGYDPQDNSAEWNGTEKDTEG